MGILGKHQAELLYSFIVSLTLHSDGGAEPHYKQGIVHVKAKQF